MKTGYFLMSLLLLVPAACQKEIEDPQTDVKDLVTINASIHDSKVALTPDGIGLHLAWEEGDCLRVISGSQSEKFTIKPGFTDHQAQFTGAAVAGETFDIMYPGSFSSVEEAEETDFSYQVQNGNGNTGHLRFASLLEGVNDYKDIAFTGEWAAAHGGSIKSAGAVRLELTLPAGVSAVDNVSIDLAGRKLSLQLENVDVSASGQVLTAYLMTPWADIVLPAGSAVEVAVADPEMNVFGTTITLDEEKTLSAGEVSNFKISKNVTEYDYAGGSGTEEDPWLIANSRQLENMMKFYKESAAPAGKTAFKYWFRMLQDVDASKISWIPLNNSGSFYKAIDFDGDGHTITGLTSNGTYASFSGVLYGTVRNVTFDGATITHSSTKKGVVAGFLGTTGLPGFCENVHVINSSVSGGSYSGGFAGHVRNTGTVVNCSVSNSTVSSTSGYLGGFAAFADITGDDKYEVPVRFIDCTVDNVTVTQEYTGTTELYTGGFMGCANTGVGFTGCKVKATVNVSNTSMTDVGGFIGRASYACPTFRDCHVLEGSTVNSKCKHTGGFTGYSIVAASYTDCSSAATVVNESEWTGGFVGYSAGASTYTNCSASGNVSSVKHAGGFVGTAENSAFNDCFYTTGTVTENNSGKSQSGGFCGYASEGVSFRGCSVRNATFAANSGTYVGGFVGQLGYSYNGGNNVSASQCYVEGTTVTGSTNCGGFVGVQYDDITSCYVSGGSINARNAHCGGFSGFVQNGNLRNCYSTASVNGGSYAQVGGFAGIVYTTDISYCYFAGSISASGSDAGAFIGKCDQQNTGVLANVSNCIGWNAQLPFCGTNSVEATITGCYAGTEGTVSAKAQEQTWPDAVWNLSASLPTLLDTPRRINAIFIGDSITWQWAITSRTDDKSKIVVPIDPLPYYMTISGNNVTSKFHPGFFTGNGYIDKGVSGQNTTQMLKRFKGDIIDLEPIVVVIMGGTNDLAQGYSEEQILANLSAMAEMADAAGIKVVMCSVTPNNRSYSKLSNPSTKGAHIIALNNLIQNYVATKGFTYCDYWSSLVADDGLAMKTDYLLYDDLHPGPAGYDIMEGIIKSIIDGLMIP